MTSTTDAEIAARYGVSVDEEAEGIAEPWNTDGGNVRPIAALSEWTGKAASWLVLPLVAVLALEALRRRIFGDSFIWAQDIAYMLYATHFLLGSAFTLKRSGHIRTDFRYRDWKPRTQAGVDFAVYLFLFIPALAVAVWVSADFAWEAFQRKERVIRSAWQDGPLWPLLAILPLGLTLWLLQSISETVKSFRVMRSGQWEPPLDATTATSKETEIPVGD